MYDLGNKFSSSIRSEYHSLRYNQITPSKQIKSFLNLLLALFILYFHRLQILIRTVPTLLHEWQRRSYVATLRHKPLIVNYGLFKLLILLHTPPHSFVIQTRAKVEHSLSHLHIHFSDHLLPPEWANGYFLRAGFWKVVILGMGEVGIYSDFFRLEMSSSFSRSFSFWLLICSYCLWAWKAMEYWRSFWMDEWC